jgi:hypothetical protein
MNDLPSTASIVVTRYHPDTFGVAEAQVRPVTWDHHNPDGSPALFKSTSATPFLDCQAWMSGNNIELNSAIWM